MECKVSVPLNRNTILFYGLLLRKILVRLLRVTSKNGMVVRMFGSSVLSGSMNQIMHLRCMIQHGLVLYLPQIDSDVDRQGKPPVHSFFSFSSPRAESFF